MSEPTSREFERMLYAAKHGEPVTAADLYAYWWENRDAIRAEAMTTDPAVQALTPEEWRETRIALLNRFHYVGDGTDATDNPIAKSAYDKIAARASAPPVRHHPGMSPAARKRAGLTPTSDPGGEG
jgi:hypothetical protein